MKTSYTIIHARTDAEKLLSFRLRYQVYCLEKSFEEAHCFPNGIEKDCFDDVSEHFIAVCNETNQPIATVRLVFGKRDELPVSQRSKIIENGSNNKIVAEYSRLCCLKAEKQKLKGKNAQDRKNVIIDLVNSANVFLSQAGVNNVYALMAPSLARHLQRKGLHSIQVGPSCNFRGERRPYRFQTDHTVSHSICAVTNIEHGPTTTRSIYKHAS